MARQTSWAWIRVSLILMLLGLFLGRMGRAPLFLYPSTPSLPAGLYIKVGGKIEHGSIIAFPVPKNAQAYQHSIGQVVDPGFLFLKPVIAMSGDSICNDKLDDFRINGVHAAQTANQDREGNALPVWQGCRSLVRIKKAEPMTAPSSRRA